MSYLSKLTEKQAAEFADFLIDIVKTGKYDKYRTYHQVRTAMLAELTARDERGEPYPTDIQAFKKDLIANLGFDGEKVQIPADKEGILRENLTRHLTEQIGESWETGSGGDWRIRKIFRDSGIDVFDKNIFGFDGRIGIHFNQSQWSSYVNYSRWDQPEQEHRDEFPLKEQGNVPFVYDTPVPPQQVGPGQKSAPRPVIIGTRDV